MAETRLFIGANKLIGCPFFPSKLEGSIVAGTLFSVNSIPELGLHGNMIILFRCLDIGKNALIKLGACDTFLHLFEIEISILRRYINFFGYGSHIYVSNV